MIASGSRPIRKFRLIRMPEGHTPQPGEIAPEFTLPDSTGTPRTLTQLVSERPRVLIFYRGHW